MPSATIPPSAAAELALVMGSLSRLAGQLEELLASSQVGGEARRLKDYAALAARSLERAALEAIGGGT